MVKRIVLLLFLLIGNRVNAQFLHIGAKIGVGTNSSMETNSKAYYLNSMSVYDSSVTVQLNGESKLVAVLIPEFYLRYDAKNFWFIQTGFLSQNYDVFLKQDESVYMKYWAEGSSVQDIRISLGYNSVYLNGGIVLMPKRLIKPYVTGGLSLNVLYLYKSAPSWNNIDGYESIVQDLDRLSPITLFGRAGVGLRFYDFNLEYTLQQNLSQLDSSADPFYKKMTAGYISVGYSFLIFNTIKKANK